VNSEFLDSLRNWACPDIESYELYKNPAMYKNGSSLVAVVNRCDVATKIDQENNLTSYSKLACVPKYTSKVL